ncbi:hypothetical protein F4604DRAFT_1917351 [Suillus subluteus]|nr:hypothetical protein F4604DRAFT_1917351 [Suillus subluteus]
MSSAQQLLGLEIWVSYSVAGPPYSPAPTMGPQNPRAYHVPEQRNSPVEVIVRIRRICNHRDSGTRVPRRVPTGSSNYALVDKDIRVVQKIVVGCGHCEG